MVSFLTDFSCFSNSRSSLLPCGLISLRTVEIRLYVPPLIQATVHAGPVTLCADLLTLVWGSPVVFILLCLLPWKSCAWTCAHVLQAPFGALCWKPGASKNMDYYKHWV